MKKIQSKRSLKNIASTEHISKSKQIKSKSKIKQQIINNLPQRILQKQKKNPQKIFQKQQRYLIQCNKCGQLIDRSILNSHLKQCNQVKQDVSIFSQLDQCVHCKRIVPKLIKEAHVKKCSKIAQLLIRNKKSKLKTINSQKKIFGLNSKRKQKTNEDLQKVVKQSKQKVRQSKCKSKILKNKLVSSKQKQQKKKSLSKNIKSKKKISYHQIPKNQFIKQSRPQSKKSKQKKIHPIQTTRQVHSNLLQNTNPIQITRQGRGSSLPRTHLIQRIQQLNINRPLNNLEIEVFSNNYNNLIDTFQNIIYPLENNRRFFAYQLNNSQDIFQETLPQNPNNKNSGLEADHIQTIPIHIFNRSRTATVELNSESSKSCSVCLLDFKNGDPLKTLYCSHSFHQQCIDKWLQMKSTCPVCRQKLI